MKPIAAIWHHPGTPPNRAGAGDYPVAILWFMPGPTTQAIVADTGGRLNTAPMAELEVVDPTAKEAVALANTTIVGRTG
jgi:hypothetical protein